MSTGWMVSTFFRSESTCCAVGGSIGICRTFTPSTSMTWGWWGSMFTD
ncbi:hypothetical protein [Nonomuraea pusilla]|nr:hypothetical protein [Nonomuraea pusilla]